MIMRSRASCDVILVRSYRTSIERCCMGDTVMPLFLSNALKLRPPASSLLKFAL